jgi:hypothetical protein
MLHQTFWLRRRFYRRVPAQPALGDVLQARAGESAILCANAQALAHDA